MVVRRMGCTVMERKLRGDSQQQQQPLPLTRCHHTAAQQTDGLMAEMATVLGASSVNVTESYSPWQAIPTLQQPHPPEPLSPPI